MASDHMNAHTCKDGQIRYESPCPVCQPIATKAYNVTKDATFGQYDITKAGDRKTLRVAFHLLDPPAQEVARALMNRIEVLEDKLRWKTIDADGRPPDAAWLCVMGGHTYWMTNGKSLVSTDVPYFIMPELL